MRQQDNHKSSNHIKAELIEKTKLFCSSKIDEEYADLCQRLIEKLARKRSVPFLTGNKNIWAASIIWAIGRINFLGDKSFSPYLTLEEIADFFNTSKSTVGQKAGKICEMCNLAYYDPDFSTERMRKNNPFSRMASINGFLCFLPEEADNQI